MTIDSQEIPEITVRDTIIEDTSRKPTFIFFSFMDMVRKLIIALDAEKLEAPPSDGQLYGIRDGQWEVLP